MKEVKVSSQDEDDGLYDPAALGRPGQTDIFISPHYVPQISPHKVNHMSSVNGDTPSSRASSSYSGLPVSPAGASALELGSGSAIVKQYSYDAEESFMLTEGVQASSSDLNGDEYDGLNNMPSTQSKESSERKIMVQRPYRSNPDDSITSATSVLSNSRRSTGSPWDEQKDTAAAANSARGDVYTNSWSQANQKSQSSILTRAREVLRSNDDHLDSPQVQLGKAPFTKGGSPTRVKQRLFHGSDGAASDVSYDQDLEDGLAALGSGGDGKAKQTFHRDMLTNRPEEHMQEIYEEASRCMKNYQYDQAVEYFEVVLRCQRRRYGPFHQDVAAALHNCGLAHLRTGDHHRAIQSFEEAARIRKGTLGKEHPHVAASLVKCGITYLLLHRFEDALRCLREALAIRKHSLGALHPSTARIMNNIGCVHVEFKELREARRAFEGALDIQRNALCHDPESGPIRFGAATTLCNLGYLYRHRDMHERAAQVLREAADVSFPCGFVVVVLSILDCALTLPFPLLPIFNWHRFKRPYWVVRIPPVCQPWTAWQKPWQTVARPPKPTRRTNSSWNAFVPRNPKEVSVDGAPKPVCTTR